MSNKRKSISKKKRFDVFKRDSFTCQYCGKKAPDVILEVDHIKPISKGGHNGITNLITSCFDCNRGKGAKELKDNETVDKKMKQLELLNVRKEQIEMIFNWEQELLRQDEEIINKVCDYWEELSGTTINDVGVKRIRTLINKYEIKYILLGIKGTLSSYDDPEVAFKKLKNVISTIILQEKKPYMKDLFYIRAIIRNKSTYNGYVDRYYDSGSVIRDLEKLYEKGYSTEKLKSLAMNFDDLSDFALLCHNEGIKDD